MQHKILIAGIGNIFLGDDAFGVEVAQRLSRRKLPDWVRVVDFGIRGLDLAYALMDGYDVTILVDATPRGDAPGTIYTIEPDLEHLQMPDLAAVDGHAMNPMNVFALVKSMGGRCKRILIVGCEPEPLLEEDGRMGLSEPISGAVDRAIEVIGTLIARELANHSLEAYSQIPEAATLDGSS